MRLVLFDLDPGESPSAVSAPRVNFHPLALGRPIWELRCGMTTLAEKLIRLLRPAEVACFVPAYMAGAYRARTAWPVNDPASLGGADLLLVSPRLKATAQAAAEIAPGGDAAPAGSRVALGRQGEVLYAVIARGDLRRLKAGAIEDLLASARETLPTSASALPTWNYVWELVLANPDELRADFAAAGRSGVEGEVEQPCAIRGGAGDVYVASGVRVHPMVVLDATGGPIYIDRGAEIHPFTRIEGPCYVGPRSILLGAKCREGSSIGPHCRVGGEVEESIVHGYSNKYHDGFLGHAYVGEWVNLGAMTANSDLKNDYASVTVCLDGKRQIDTGSTKVGALIGDHTKTSIGTLLNTGAVVGAMCLILTDGRPLPKFLPSFSWYLDGVVTKGFGKRKLYETASAAMCRRGCRWTPAEEAMWDAVFEQTAAARSEAVRRGRRALRR